MKRVLLVALALLALLVVADRAGAAVAERVLANMLVGFGLTMLVLGFCEASIYALLDAFDKPATYAGVFVTLQGVGAIAGGLSAGGVVLFISVLAGGVVAGRLVAAPVVVPGWLLPRGVTSRMPGGAAGVAGCVCCAVWLGGVVPAWFTVVLFKP